MNRFKFERSSDCPSGEYVLVADERFRVEVQGQAAFLVVEVPLQDGLFVKVNHHGRHTELQPALDEAAERAVPIKPRTPWRTSERAA